MDTAEEFELMVYDRKPQRTSLSENWTCRNLLAVLRKPDLAGEEIAEFRLRQRRVHLTKAPLAKLTLEALPEAVEVAWLSFAGEVVQSSSASVPHKENRVGRVSELAELRSPESSFALPGGLGWPPVTCWRTLCDAAIDGWHTAATPVAQDMTLYSR